MNKDIPDEMVRRKNKVAIEFSRKELITLRRLLNRAVDSAEGVKTHRINAWYYAEPILKKIQEAIRRLRT